MMEKALAQKVAEEVLRKIVFVYFFKGWGKASRQSVSSTTAGFDAAMPHQN